MSEFAHLESYFILCTVLACMLHCCAVGVSDNATRDSVPNMMYLAADAHFVHDASQADTGSSDLLDVA